MRTRNCFRTTQFLDEFLNCIGVSEIQVSFMCGEEGFWIFSRVTCDIQCDKPQFLLSKKKKRFLEVQHQDESITTACWIEPIHISFSDEEMTTCVYLKLHSLVSVMFSMIQNHMRHSVAQTQEPSLSVLNIRVWNPGAPVSLYLLSCCRVLITCSFCRSDGLLLFRTCVMCTCWCSSDDDFSLWNVLNFEITLCYSKSDESWCVCVCVYVVAEQICGVNF